MIHNIDGVSKQMTGVLLGWRAMEIRYCTKCGWVLRGKHNVPLPVPARERHRLTHLTGPVSPSAVCAGYSRAAAEGLSYPVNHKPPPAPHAAPADGCTCGYYILWQPQREEVPAGILYNYLVYPTFWAWCYVVALGAVVIHRHGARISRYRILQIFYPEPLRQNWKAEDCRVPVYDEAGYTHGDERPLSEALEAIPAKLGMEWRRDDPYAVAPYLPSGLRLDNEAHDLIARLMGGVRYD